MPHKPLEVRIPYGASELILSTGQMAKLAAGSVKAQLGESIVLVTVSIADQMREGIDFLPLTVDYEERMYAAGKISGSRFIKRESRPSEEAVLNGRLIDRSIRPLIDKNFRRDIQVIVTTLAYDEVHGPAAMAVVAASAALLQAGAPFAGPIGAVRVGYIDGQYVINPREDQLTSSTLDLVAAGNDQKIIMIESSSNEASETEVIAALTAARSALAQTLSPQLQFRHPQPITPEQIKDLTGIVEKAFGPKLKELVFETDQNNRRQALAEFTQTIIKDQAEEFALAEVTAAIDKVYYQYIRHSILNGLRPDRRDLNEIRPLSIDIAVLPRVHGSALFSRGETQALTITTLAGPGQVQWVDTLEESAKKRYMHHYNFPPFSTNEVRRLGTSRREIGHGALAEKALVPVLPSKEEFPYTIRVVTEILGSNGSTSMAAVVGSSLSLMDAGVPIKKPVAGIAMGLVCASDTEYKILTDLQGLEDFSGDMDFKIAGTVDGITAIQLDVKNVGLTAQMIEQTLTMARQARLQLLESMQLTLAKPRDELSPHAPRIILTKISTDKIGELIGPGGKNINKIIDDHGGAEAIAVDIDDDGIVAITSNNAEQAEKVKAIIESIGQPIEVGQVFDGKINQIVKDRSGKEIGVIAQISPTRDGMIHISSLGAGSFVRNIKDVVSIGDTVKVRVKEVDPEKNRISLERINVETK